MNSHTFEGIYAPAGVQIDKLGCVMLDVALPDPGHAEREPEWHVSTNPDRFWIKGRQDHAHVTLLYGLLKHLYGSPEEYRKAIDTVLEGWSKPAEIALEKVSFFPSPYTDDDVEYSCVIAHVALAPALVEGHQRLSFIPHVDTFPDYKPHVTLGYVKTRDLAYALHYFRAAYGVGVGLQTGEVDYGKMPEVIR